LRQGPCCLQDGEDVQHPVERPIERGGNADPVRRNEGPGVKKEVQGVHVVVNGLLEVHAVGLDLALRLALNDTPAEVLPVPSPH
jgi:hypothetical protein